MDFIVLLIIFGVISALGKNNKKQIQNKRPGSSFSTEPKTSKSLSKLQTPSDILFPPQKAENRFRTA